MVTVIKWLLMTVYQILPDSPFASMVDEMQLNGDFIQYLNWFLPLDIISNMMLAWLSCMLVYFLYKMVVQIVKILVKLWLTSKSVIGALAGLFTG